MNPLKLEPALTVGAIMSGVAIWAAFGGPVSPEQQNVLRENLLPIVTFIFTGAAAIRQLVVSPATAERLQQEAYAAGFANGNGAERAAG